MMGETIGIVVLMLATYGLWRVVLDIIELRRARRVPQQPPKVEASADVITAEAESMHARVSQTSDVILLSIVGQKGVSAATMFGANLSDEQATDLLSAAIVTFEKRKFKRAKAVNEAKAKVRGKGLTVIDGGESTE